MVFVRLLTTHLSSFAVGTSTGGGNGNNGGNSSGGGGGAYSTPTCTDVTYADFQGSCFSGYQYREVASRNPVGCNLTAAQLDSSRRACTLTTGGEVITTPGSDDSAFVALEKSLVTKINLALSKRLAGPYSTAGSSPRTSLVCLPGWLPKVFLRSSVRCFRHYASARSRYQWERLY